MSIIDNIVKVFSPQAALKREIAKFKINYIRSYNNSGYDESGANRSKSSMKGWNANSRSPQEDIDCNLAILRQRSRSLYMSSPVGVSAIKTNRTNIVGTGLMARPCVDSDFFGMTHEEATAWNKKTRREFDLWASSKHCDMTRVNNFYELQQVVCLSWLTNGDACALIKYDDVKHDYMPYGLRIHVIESDKISNPNTQGTHVDLQLKTAEGNRILNGVEIDDNGAVVAYHICSTYPNSNYQFEKKWQRVKAFGETSGMPNVLLIFDNERPEQYRGVPYLSPVIESIKQLTRYSEAEIMAAVINGFFTVFVTTNKDASEVPFGSLLNDDEENQGSSASELALGPGMINILEPGEDIKMADPSRPSSNFDAFTSSYAKYIGAALEIPPELLLKQFNASYSASKAALEEAWKAFKMKRSWLANDFCQPVYELFMTEAVATGRIKAPGFFLDPAIRKAWCKCAWNGPTQGMLDPLKEINAATKRVNLGVSTREIETMEMTGGDFQSNAVQLLREAEIMKEINVAAGNIQEDTESDFEKGDSENGESND